MVRPMPGAPLSLQAWAAALSAAGSFHEEAENSAAVARLTVANNPDAGEGATLYADERVKVYSDRVVVNW